MFKKEYIETDKLPWIIELMKIIVANSQWFELTPLPEGYYQIAVKVENANRLTKWANQAKFAATYPLLSGIDIEKFDDLAEKLGWSEKNNWSPMSIPVMKWTDRASQKVPATPSVDAAGKHVHEDCTEEIEHAGTQYELKIEDWGDKIIARLLLNGKRLDLDQYPIELNDQIERILQAHARPRTGVKLFIWYADGGHQFEPYRLIAGE